MNLSRDTLRDGRVLMAAPASSDKGQEPSRVPVRGNESGPDTGQGRGNGSGNGSGGNGTGDNGNGLPWLMIAISGGALSAVFMSALASPSIFSFIMFLLVPAPLFMSGLGFGWRAAAAAALAALALLAGMLGLKAALMHLVMAGLPAAWLSWLAWQHRPAAGAMEGEPVDDAGREWYPEGRLLLWMAGLAAGGVSLVLLGVGLSKAEVHDALRQLAENVMQASGLGAQASDEQKKAFLDFFAAAAPLSAAVMWLLSMFLSWRISGWLVHKMGVGQRPPADFARLSFPQAALLLLAGLSLAALLPDIFGLLGEVFALTYMAAFVILGIAVVHAWARGKPWEPLALGALYAALLMLTGLVAPVLLLLGLAEVGFGIREKMLRGGGSSADD